MCPRKRSNVGALVLEDATVPGSCTCLQLLEHANSWRYGAVTHFASSKHTVMFRWVLRLTITKHQHSMLHPTLSKLCTRTRDSPLRISLTQGILLEFYSWSFSGGKTLSIVHCSLLLPMKIGLLSKNGVESMQLMKQSNTHLSHLRSSYVETFPKGILPTPVQLAQITEHVA